MAQILPEKGIITIKDLSEFLRITDFVLIENLRKENVKILKLGKYRRHWIISLEDLNSKIYND